MHSFGYAIVTTQGARHLKRQHGAAGHTLCLIDIEPGAPTEPFDLIRAECPFCVRDAVRLPQHYRVERIRVLGGQEHSHAYPLIGPCVACGEPEMVSPDGLPFP